MKTKHPRHTQTAYETSSVTRHADLEEEEDDEPFDADVRPHNRDLDSDVSRSNFAEPGQQEPPRPATPDSSVTADSDWVYFSVEANLYSEDDELAFPRDDLDKAFSILVKDAKGAAVLQDDNRRITKMRPIMIYFRMEKPEADKETNGTLERILQLELARSLFELLHGPGRRLSIMTWERLKHVKAVPISTLKRATEPDADYAKHLGIIHPQTNSGSCAA